MRYDDKFILVWIADKSLTDVNLERFKRFPARPIDGVKPGDESMIQSIANRLNRETFGAPGSYQALPREVYGIFRKLSQ